MVKVSVIVPVYNAVKHIDKCLKELLNQTYQNYEVIFVNDGSSDDSLKMLEDYASTNDKITIFSKENGGQASARNVGLTKAQGEFICFVDIDDHVSIDMLEKLMEMQEKENADIVWCNSYVEKENQIIGRLDDDIVENQNPIKKYILNNNSPWRKIIRKDLLIRHDLYFPMIRFYEDIAIVPTYALYTNKIAYVNEPLYYYVLHEGSTMHQQKYTTKLECIFKALDYMKSKFLNSGKFKKYEKEIEYLYVEHLLHAASLRFFKFEEGKESLKKIVKIINTDFRQWKQNVYYKNKGWKYKLVCNLFYYEKYKLLKLLLK